MEVINDDMDDGNGAGEGAEDEMRLQIESNDPSLTELNIGGYSYTPRDGNWESLGAAIGRNTHLIELTLYDIERHEDLKSLLPGLSANQSIKKLSVSGSNKRDKELFSLLVPFFKNNHSFESLEIAGCSIQQPSTFVSVAMALQQFNSLKEFLLSCNDFGYDVDTTKLIQSLARHSELRKLCLCETPMGRGGYSTLADLLQNPNSRLAVLGLSASGINDEKAVILANSLDGNSTLKELHLGNNLSVTETGWIAIFTALGNTRCILEKLSLRANFIDDVLLQCLLNTLILWILAGIGTLPLLVGGL